MCKKEIVTYIFCPNGNGTKCLKYDISKFMAHEKPGRVKSCTLDVPVYFTPTFKNYTHFNNILISDDNHHYKYSDIKLHSDL